MRKNIYNMWKSFAVCLFCLMGALPLSAQQRTVSGTVVDNEGEPLAGALVSVTGSDSRVAVTSANGSFSLQATSSETLTASFFGYTNTVVQADRTQLVITLQADNTRLEEIVVVGYGAQRKATLTGAVSAVSNREITVTKNENVINMITGKLPGVRVMQTSSQPGKFDDVKMDIRGMGAPLVVVDGIPRDAGYFASMDSNDIEQVSVLKDASAAIYGVQAANGVVMVTTKRGQASDGKFNITFSANYGIQGFLYIPETASAIDHMLLYNEKSKNDLAGNYPVFAIPRYSYEEMLALGADTGTNWTEELFRKSVPQQSYNVSLDGGSDKVNYFFNLGYLDQEGSYKSGSLNFRRWNFRSNTDVQITKRLKASVQLSGYMGERNEPNTAIWTVYKKAWTYRPTSEPWLDDAKTIPAWDDEMLEPENPVASTDAKFAGFRRFKNVNFNGTLSLDYQIPGVKGLTARALYNYTYYTDDNTIYQRLYNLYQNTSEGVESLVRNDLPTLRRESSPGHDELVLLSLNYDNKFGDHTVGAMVAFEERYGFKNGFWGQVPMTVDSEYPTNGGMEDHVVGQQGLEDWARRAVIGRVTYNYKERYLFESTFRADASSSFSMPGKWGYFPSFLAAWRLSEEPFMKRAVPFLSNLKLRASWGVMGDDAGSRRGVTAYSIVPNDVVWYYGGRLISGVESGVTPNLDKTWFTSRTFNAGIDFDLWNGKLSGTFEYFQRNRDGLLRDPETDVPVEVGAKLDQVNSDKDMTFGWEILLGHRNTVAGIHYWVDAQISATKNRWGYYRSAPANNSLLNWQRQDVSGRNKDIWWVNEEEAGRFTSYEQIRNHGIPVEQNSLPGDYYYEDWNGDGIVNSGDKHPVATYNLPVFNYGINIGARWKNLDMSMNWAGSAGVYNSYNEVFAEVAPFDGGAVLDIYKDRWRTEHVYDDPWNPNTKWIEGKYPATRRSFSTGTTGIHNTSFIRLKTLEFGYTLPAQWLQRLSVRELRVYVNAYNLLTFTKNKDLDPERPGHRGSANEGTKEGELFYNYPVNRVFNMGVTLKF